MSGFSKLTYCLIPGEFRIEHCSTYGCCASLSFCMLRCISICLLMMMCIILSNLSYSLYQESYCIETIVQLDVVLYSQSVLLSHWKVTTRVYCVVYCHFQRIQRIQINLFATTNTFCYGINKQDIQYNYKTNRNY